MAWSWSGGPRTPLGVLAEGADYLADAAAIAVSLLAMALSGGCQPEASTRIPESHHEPAGVNAGGLLVLSVLVAAGAADRLLTGTHPVHGLPVLIISGTAAVVMFACALILALVIGCQAVRLLREITAALGRQHALPR